MPRDPVCCCTLSSREPEGMQVGEQGHVSVIYTRSPAGKEDGFLFCETRHKTKRCPAHSPRRSPRPYFVLHLRRRLSGAGDRAFGRRQGRVGISQPPRHLPAHALVLPLPAADGCGTKPVPKAWQSATGESSPPGAREKSGRGRTEPGPRRRDSSGGDRAVGCFFCEKGTLCVKIQNNG